jgi:acyl carrier protein
VPLDLAALWRDVAPLAAAEARRSTATVRLCGTNYGKPYPPREDDPNSSEVLNLMPQSEERAVERPVSLPPAADGEAEWLQTLREVHRLATEAQASYQRAMADTQLAYLAAVGKSLGNGEGPPQPVPIPQVLNAASGDGAAADHTTQPAAVVETMVAPPMESPLPADTFDPPPADTFDTEIFAAEPAHSAPVTETAEAAPEPVEAAPEPSAGDSGAGDGGDAAAELTALTLRVVADKTGYPAEILRPEMHLQADLGVDSIKRVEVLSALREHVEGLPAIDAAELGRLQTIEDIANKLVTEVGR